MDADGRVEDLWVSGGKVQCSLGRGAVPLAREL
jgi:hypothetical protein